MFSNPFDLFTVVTGVALLMKKLSEIDRFDDLRAVTLTVIFFCVALYVFNCVRIEAGMFYDCGFQSDFSPENM